MTNSERGTRLNPNAAFTRRHDLDWLRIIAFGLLIFYHVGMFFNTAGWHAKSHHANAAMEPIMWLSSPWRLPLLFLISGVALRFLSDKLGSVGFARERFVRLFPVILFGMYVVVAPQTYVQLLAAEVIGPGLWDFYRSYAFEWGGPWSVHTPTWNHLWYVVYLFVYSLILAPLIPLLRAGADSRTMEKFGNLLARPMVGPVLLIVLPILPFLLFRFTLNEQFPTTHALLDDWANHANSLTILLYGYVLAKNAALWRAIARAWPAIGVLTLALFAFLLTAYMNFEVVFSVDWLAWTARIARIVFAWSIILTLLGAAQAFLNRDGPVRRYLTEAIFPVYILHQTITVTAGYWMAQQGWDVWTEFAALTAITALGSFAGFELIRRIPVLRPVFGLKLQSKQRKPAPTAAE